MSSEMVGKAAEQAILYVFVEKCGDGFIRAANKIFEASAINQCSTACPSTAKESG
jgi:hypothetical protein